MATEGEDQPLAHLHVSLNDEWLKVCREFCKSKGLEPGPTELFEQFLFSDMKQSCRGHPSKIPAKAKKAVLQKCYVLQVVSVLNIAQPAYDQYCELTATEDDLRWFHGEDDEGESHQVQQRNLPSHQRRRMLKIELTDGTSTFEGVEFGVLMGINENTAPGTKVLLTPRLLCRAGCIFLSDQNCQVLGGDTEGRSDRRLFLADVLKITDKIKEKTPTKPSVQQPPPQKSAREKLDDIKATAAANAAWSALRTPTAPAPKQVVPPLRPAGIVKNKAPPRSSKTSSSRLNSSILNTSAQSTLSPFLVRKIREKVTTEQRKENSVPELKRENSVIICSPFGTTTNNNSRVLTASQENRSASTENLLRIPGRRLPDGSREQILGSNNIPAGRKPPEPVRNRTSKKNAIGPYRPNKKGREHSGSGGESPPRKYQTIAEYYKMSRRKRQEEAAAKRRFDESNDGDGETSINQTTAGESLFNFTAASERALSTSFRTESSVPKPKPVPASIKLLQLNRYMDNNNNSLSARIAEAQREKKLREAEAAKSRNQPPIQQQTGSYDSFDESPQLVKQPENTNERLQESLFNTPPRRKEAVQKTTKPAIQKVGEASSLPKQQQATERQNCPPWLNNDGMEDDVPTVVTQRRVPVPKEQKAVHNSRNKGLNPIGDFTYSRQNLHQVASRQNSQPCSVEETLVESLFGAEGSRRNESAPRQINKGPVQAPHRKPKEALSRQKQQPGMEKPPWESDEDESAATQINQGSVHVPSRVPNEAPLRQKQQSVIEKPPWESDDDDVFSGDAAIRESAENVRNAPVPMIQRPVDPRQMHQKQAQDAELYADSLFGSPRRESVPKTKKPAIPLNGEPFRQKPQHISQKQIQAPSIVRTNTVEIAGRLVRKDPSVEQMMVEEPDEEEDPTETQLAPERPPWESDTDGEPSPLFHGNINSTQFEFTDLAAFSEGFFALPSESGNGVNLERIDQRPVAETQVSVESPNLPWEENPCSPPVSTFSTPPVTMRFSGPPVLVQRKESSRSSIGTPPIQQSSSNGVSAAQLVVPTAQQKTRQNQLVQPSNAGNSGGTTVAHGRGGAAVPRQERIGQRVAPPIQQGRSSGAQVSNNVTAPSLHQNQRQKTLPAGALVSGNNGGMMISHGHGGRAAPNQEEVVHKMTPPVQQRKSSGIPVANDALDAIHRQLLQQGRKNPFAVASGNAKGIMVPYGRGEATPTQEQAVVWATPPVQQQTSSAATNSNSVMPVAPTEAPVPGNSRGIMVPYGRGGEITPMPEKAVMNAAKSHSTSDRFRQFYGTLADLEITTLKKALSECVFWMLPKVKCIQGFCKVPSQLNSKDDVWLLQVLVGDTSHGDLKCDVDPVLLDKMLGFTPYFAKGLKGLVSAAELGKCQAKAKAVSNVFKRLDLLLFIQFSPDRATLPQIVDIKSLSEIMQQSTM